LTIAFVAMMATVLAAAGVFLYAQFRSTLDAQLVNALHLQAADAGALVARGHSSAIESPTNPLTVGCRAGGCLAQIYRTDGRLLASTPQASATRLLTAAQARQAAATAAAVRSQHVTLGKVRVLAVAARAPSHGKLVVAVADSIASRDKELDRLRTLLLIAGRWRCCSRVREVMSWRAPRCVQSTGCAREPSGSPSGKLSERLPVSDAADEIGALGRTLNACSIVSRRRSRASGESSATPATSCGPR